MKRSIRRAVATLIAALFSTPAFAHVGLGDQGGFAHGFMHPIGGMDHVLAMVAVGVFAASLGGRALWLVPSAFVGMMAVGGGLGFSGIEVPYVEAGIALSVLVLGALVASGIRLPIAAAMTLVGLFAIFHGHAHGSELPNGATPAAFAAGFIAATAMLHVVGIGLGVTLARLARVQGIWTRRVVGGAVAIAGATLLAG